LTADKSIPAHPLPDFVEDTNRRYRISALLLLLLLLSCLSLMATSTSSKNPLWLPCHTSSTPTILRFIEYVNKKHNINLQTYEDIYRWTVHPTTIGIFWRDAYIFLGLAPIEKHPDEIGPALETTAGS
jgi:hypothetical protein